MVWSYLMKRRLIWIGLIAMIGSTMAAESPDVSMGLKKSEPCVVCHGIDGNSPNPAWPNIAGQPEKYLIEQLKEFRKGDKGTRFNPVMFGIVQGLSDEDIQDLAKYYANQQPSLGAVRSNFVSLGEKIYRGGNVATGVVACSGCHDPNGEGNPEAGFPPLSGQHPQYLIDQLKKFKNNERSNDPNGIMRDIAKRMTDEEIEAVCNYVSGLH